MTSEQFYNAVLSGIKRLYPGYTPEDYARLAGKAKATFEDWAKSNYTGARKAHDVKVVNVPRTAPKRCTRVSFQTMGKVKDADLEWTDTHTQGAPAQEAPKPIAPWAEQATKDTP